MNFFFYPPAKKQDESSRSKPVTIQDTPHYTNEGSEFLDDAIRMKDQPIMYTEVSIAPGSPENLW